MISIPAGDQRGHDDVGVDIRERCDCGWLAHRVPGSDRARRARVDLPLRDAGSGQLSATAQP